jgi:release factor glutamine methyltransferase
MNIKHSLIKIGQKLETAGIENPSLEAELLICRVLKKQREFILAYPELALNSSQKRVLEKLVTRRMAHEPLAYLLGKQQFYNINLVKISGVPKLV